MKVIARYKSTVIIQDKKGRYWVTRRKKRRHDGRRQKGRECRVVYLPLYRIAHPFFYNK